MASKTGLPVALACGAILVGAVVGGYFLIRSESGSGSATAPPDGNGAATTLARVVNDLPEPKGATAATMPAPPATMGSVAAAPDSRPGTSGPARAPVPVTLEAAEWTASRNGCAIDLDGGKIHIVGTNNGDGWGRENCVTGKTEYPAQDFEIATDFLMPKLEGPGMSTVILRARESSFRQVTLQYFVEGNRYMLRWWTNGGEEFAPTTLPKFGDEATKYHRLKLKYVAATHTFTGWVDDKQVGTLDFELRGNVRFVVGLATDKKGYDVDLMFDHTTLNIAGSAVGPSVP